MEQNDIVSVIVPVFNVERYVERCLRSILNQKYKNIEIVVVDDGSTDNSGKICKEIAKEDNRIIIIQKENGGLSSARNCGLKHSHGKYIAFVDADDFIREEYISCMYDISVKSCAEIVICGYKKGKKNKFSKKCPHKQYQIYSSKEMLKNWHASLSNIETMAWNKLYLKELLTKMEFQFPEGVYYEDVRTIHLIVEKAEKIAITDNELYYYYQRKGSITKKMGAERNIKDNIEAQNMRIEFFESHGYVDASDRLKIGRQKFYMLFYWMTKSLNMKNEIRFYYKEANRDVCHSKEIGFSEKILFATFERIFIRNKQEKMYADKN